MLTYLVVDLGKKTRHTDKDCWLQSLNVLNKELWIPTGESNLHTIVVE